MHSRSTNDRSPIRRERRIAWCRWLLGVGLCGFCGCAAPRGATDLVHSSPAAETRLETQPDATVELVVHQETDALRTEEYSPQPIEDPAPRTEGEPVQIPPLPAHQGESLADLEALALAGNRKLHRLHQEYAALLAKVDHIDKLPDPVLGANLFAHPIETAAGSQRANLSVMQMIPWLERLDAKAQQACYEALAAGQQLEAERLNTIADIRALWYQLYVLHKQLETARAKQQLIERLIESATRRVSIGLATQGDVSLGSLEYSRIEEQILMFRQQMESAQAELNRTIGRDAETPIAIPEQLNVVLPDWTHAQLRQQAWSMQPAIAAAQLRTHATRWGIEVARLQRRPDVSLSATWFAIDDNRPTPNLVDVGRDAWSVGAQVSIPLWHRQYDALESEATWRHYASHASVEDEMRRYDALLRDLWKRAQTAQQTATLYQETILPQAVLTLESDRESYAVTGQVEFDRVIRDFRNVLTLEIGYHQAIGAMATALARIQQATGSYEPTTASHIE